jgi:hypothetical protein
MGSVLGDMESGKKTPGIRRCHVTGQGRLSRLRSGDDGEIVAQNLPAEPERRGRDAAATITSLQPPRGRAMQPRAAEQNLRSAGGEWNSASSEPLRGVRSRSIKYTLLCP